MATAICCCAVVSKVLALSSPESLRARACIVRGKICTDSVVFAGIWFAIVDVDSAVSSSESTWTRTGVSLVGLNKEKKITNSWYFVNKPVLLLARMPQSHVFFNKLLKNWITDNVRCLSFRIISYS